MKLTLTIKVILLFISFSFNNSNELTASIKKTSIHNTFKRAFLSISNDSLTVCKLNKQAQELLNKGESKAALKVAYKALKIADSLSYIKEQGKSFYLLGKANRQIKDYAQALDYYLQSLNLIHQTVGNNKFLSKVYAEIGFLYLDWQIFNKAVENLSKSYQLIGEVENTNPFRFLVLEQQAYAYVKLDKNEEALSIYIQLLNEVKEAKNQKQELQLLNTIASIYNQTDIPEEAAFYTHQILKIHQEKADSINIASTLNNLGYLYKQLEYTEESLQFFEKSLSINLRLNKSPNFKERISNNTIITTTRNIGILHLTEGETTKAINSLKEALQYSSRSLNRRIQVEILNELAQAFLINNELYSAKLYAMEACNSSKSNNWLKEYAEACKILSDVYQKIKLNKKALKYYQEYAKSIDIINQEINKQKEEELVNRINAEKTEQQLKQLIAEKEMRELSLNQLKLQTQQQENELELLKKQQELEDEKRKIEDLQKQKAIQELKLSNEILLSDKKDREIEDLQKNQLIKSFELAQQRLKEEERQREIDLLERNNQILNQATELNELKYQETIKERNYTFLLAGLFAIIVIFAFIVLYQRQKVLRKLKEQKREIEHAHHSLQLKNRYMNDGISYAKTIQSAMLPKLEFIEGGFKDCFLYYEPKAIVSGDFYWFHIIPPSGGKPERVFIAIVDCTGHGVPGGFMSMIGLSQLNTIVKEQKIEEPSLVIKQLNHSIQSALNQVEGRNKDGMDLIFCKIEPVGRGLKKITFASAIMSLFHYQKKEHNLNVIKGDLARVGGHQSEGYDFISQEIIAQPGDRVYLMSDGLVDQCNVNRRRFGSFRVQSTILNSAYLSLNKQKQFIEDTIAEYKGASEQRDDITLFAFEI